MTLSRVGLGTVQFGQDYGISNRRGQPSEAEVAAILARATTVGVGYLDTAFDYGAAEAIAGRHLPDGHGFRIVTKLPRIHADAIDASHAGITLDNLAGSLDRLRQRRVYAALIHNVADLAKPGWQHLASALQEAKRRGLVEKIGVSIYDPEDLALIEGRLEPELVQAPLNVLDRRLVTSGALDRLKQRGVEVHTRSAFLQGLLLMTPAELPEFFAPIRPHIANWRQWCKSARLSVLAGCLAYVLGHRVIDAVIVGVNGDVELRDIETAVAASASAKVDFEPSPPPEQACIDPRRWPAMVH
jgi:aryl-alcohol dehydrogenase-like predicted oxidoreductase